jgi:hypothetical protein
VGGTETRRRQVDTVRRPRCGRPGRVERDWLGDERVVCDSAYDPCEPEEGDLFPWDELVPDDLLRAAVREGRSVCHDLLALEAERWARKRATWGGSA